MKISPGALHFMVNHVILPPKLPQEEDRNHDYELALIEFARRQAITFQSEVSVESKSCWAGIVKMLTTWLEINAHELISKEALTRATTALHPEGSTLAFGFRSRHQFLALTPSKIA